MNIAAGLSGLKAAADLTKAMRDAAKAGTLKPDEFAGRIGEIYDYIADSKVALVEAKDEIQKLQGQIDAFDDERAFRESLEFQLSGPYKRNGPRGEELYCSHCLDLDGKRVRLIRSSGDMFCTKHGTRDG